VIFSMWRWGNPHKSGFPVRQSRFAFIRCDALIGMKPSTDQHAIAIAVETVTGVNRVPVTRQNAFASRQRADQRE
jgi:hypothetical protein